MKCPKCNSEYEGDFCPKCNNLPTLPQENGSNKKLSKLLGFRTNTAWKKVLSILYLIFCLLYLISVIFAEKYVNITNYDFMISQICDFLIFVIMISPYIFLSNTKFRDKLPLFKKHTQGASLAGLLIITVIIGIASGVLEEAHSKEFLADRENHAYKETVTEATCEKDGEIKKSCEYCGLTETEKISAPGHKMEEVSRKEATETENGEIVKKCSVCGKEEKTVLEKLKSTAGKTESSENESKNESKPNAASSNDASSKDASSKANSSKVDSSKATSSKENSNNSNSDSEKSSSKIESEINSLSKTEEEIFQEYADACIYIDYELLLRRPDDYIGTKVTYEGYVFDISENLFSDSNTYLIKINRDEYDYWKDVIYVSYTLPKGASKILEGDVVQIYGEYKGDTTYITTDWDGKTVPYIKAEYILFIVP